MSLLSHLFNDARKGFSAGPYDAPGVVYLNYGFDNLRLVTPIRAGARIRGHFAILSNTDRTRDGHAILKLACRIEIDGRREPALVAEWLTVGVSAAVSFAPPQPSY